MVSFNLTELNDEIFKCLNEKIENDSLFRLFYNSLKSYEEEKKFNIVHIEPVKYQILIGFKEYQSWRRKNSKANLLPKKFLRSSPFHSFINFLFSLVDLIKLLPYEEKVEFNQRIRTNCFANNNFTPFAGELLVFQYLKGNSFNIEGIPDLLVKNKEDFLISKNGQKFSVECKTFDRDGGHPIYLEVATKFLNNLDQSYLQQIPKNSLIEFTFDKKLAHKSKKKLANKKNEDIYEAEELVKKFKTDFENKANNINIKNFDCSKLTIDNFPEKMAEEFDDQSRLFYFKENPPRILKLKSTQLNEFQEKLINQIVNGSKEKNVDHPLVLYIV